MLLSSSLSSTLIYVNADSTAHEVCGQLQEYLHINDDKCSDYFGLYESIDGSSPTHSLHDTDTLLKARDHAAKLMYTVKFMPQYLVDCVSSNQVVRRLVYFQLRHDFLLGHIFVDNMTVLKLACILFQENFGNPSASNHRSGFLPPGKISEYIPWTHVNRHSPQEWERLIFQEHTTLYDNFEGSGIKLLPQLHFCNTCREVAPTMCGSKVWDVQQKILPNLPKHILLGINEAGITFYNPEVKRKHDSFPLKTLGKWGFKNGETFWMQLKPTKDSKGSKGALYEFQTAQGHVISAYLTSLCSLLLHCIRANKREKLPAICIQTAWRAHSARVELDNKIHAIEVRLTLAVMEASKQTQLQ